MRTVVITLALALAVGLVAVPAAAQTEAEQPTKVEQLRQQFLEERAEILSMILEKHAEVVRLSTAKDPEVERIQALVKEIAELRDKQASKCAEYKATVAALGLPDLIAPAGVRAGRLGIGPGAAHRPHWGQGSGRYPCPWQSYAPGRGRAGRPGPDAGGGPGWGRGGRGYSRPLGPSALGQGYAPGRIAPWAGSRQGLGPGFGAGPRQGPAWDAPGRGQGMGAGFGPPVGPGVPRAGAQGPGAYGPGFGRFGGGRMVGPGTRAWGPGPYFIDRDNDGVCDYWEGQENPPAPPVEEPAEAPAE